VTYDEAVFTARRLCQIYTGCGVTFKAFPVGTIPAIILKKRVVEAPAIFAITQRGDSILTTERREIEPWLTALGIEPRRTHGDMVLTEPPEGGTP
jgi:hypothetical protein